MSRHERRRDLVGTLQHRGERYLFVAKLDVAARDPGDVEQIVYQPGEVARMPLDHLLLAGRGGIAREQLRRRRDGREGVTQLVPEHGEEFVFAMRRFENIGGFERGADEVCRAAKKHAISLVVERTAPSDEQAAARSTQRHIGFGVPKLGGSWRFDGAVRLIVRDGNLDGREIRLGHRLTQPMGALLRRRSRQSDTDELAA